MAMFILPIAGITLYGVIMRYLFHRPAVWVPQVLLLIFIPVAVLGGGYLIRINGHVRLDALYSRWSPRTQAISNAATFIIFLLFATMLAWATIDMAWTSTAMGEKTWYAFQGPVYPKKIAIALATVLILLQGVVQFVRTICFIRGKGTRGTDNES